ncbi:hypothetical protein [Actinokineospora sp. NPDC004072]
MTLSIEAVAAELREALAKLPTGPLLQAATSFDEARTILAAVSQGTSRPEAGTAIHHLSHALTQTGEAHGAVTTARGLVEAYIALIASDAQAGTPVTTAPTRAPAAPAGLRSGVNKELVAEVQRRGDKISPKKVVPTWHRLG